MVDGPVSDLAISLRRISKHYSIGANRFDVLRSVDFNVSKGETIAIVGASGIGKSTFLHIVGTLDRPDEGQLYYNGKNVLELSDDKLARFRNKTVGFVFQFHHLLPEFTALENVSMSMRIRGISKDEAEGKAEEILKRVGLGNRLLNRPGELSGGEQQRVAIGRAIVQKPEILLADEPTGNLDRKTSRKIHELLDELNKELGMTMLVVTHNLELAGYMSRCVTLVEGRIQTSCNSEGAEHV